MDEESDEAVSTDPKEMFRSPDGPTRMRIGSYVFGLSTDVVVVIKPRRAVAGRLESSVDGGRAPFLHSSFSKGSFPTPSDVNGTDGCSLIVRSSFIIITSDDDSRGGEALLLSNTSSESSATASSFIQDCLSLSEVCVIGS